jgi:hypothetical protein
MNECEEYSDSDSGESLFKGSLISNLDDNYFSSENEDI